ncbi:MAG: hypothetical protein LC790_19510, partial [Actinobacteria bacterium]|nr:hypothetical protein [Actinomycetota bacterium]
MSTRDRCDTRGPAPRVHTDYHNLFQQPHTQDAASPEGFAKIRGYGRAHGVSAVVYQGRDGDFHELALEGGRDW